MDEASLARCLAALGQPHRLSIYRTLLSAGSDGLFAGDLARRLEMRPSLLSHHLSTLTQAGLLGHRKAATTVTYFVDHDLRREMVEALQDALAVTA